MKERERTILGARMSTWRCGRNSKMLTYLRRNLRLVDWTERKQSWKSRRKKNEKEINKAEDVPSKELEVNGAREWRQPRPFHRRLKQPKSKPSQTMEEKTLGRCQETCASGWSGYDGNAIARKNGSNSCIMCMQRIACSAASGKQDVETYQEHHEKWLRTGEESLKRGQGRRGIEPMANASFYDMTVWDKRDGHIRQNGRKCGRNQMGGHRNAGRFLGVKRSELDIPLAELAHLRFGLKLCPRPASIAKKTRAPRDVLPFRRMLNLNPEQISTDFASTHMSA
ncbi:hypothetical protein R3P38DRAFT_2786619 [Favolaschia claudopus]|uniref:Uncharacterized protein n=1 Tax=Favolaschia claudopus TaxID=2862362 RepID=A0AAW0ASU3_9AGAR